jgi:hypothetical protein
MPVTITGKIIFNHKLLVYARNMPLLIWFYLAQYMHSDKINRFFV